MSSLCVLFLCKINFDLKDNDILSIILTLVNKFYFLSRVYDNFFFKSLCEAGSIDEVVMFSNTCLIFFNLLGAKAFGARDTL